MPTLCRVGEMTSIELSVILPVFNTALFLGAALEALVRQQFSGTWEIIIADNGSTDDTVAVARSYQDRLPNLTIIDASGVQGASYARNCAVDVARGQKLVFVDGDDVPAEGYIETMSAALDENRLVCSRIDVEQLNPRWTNELRPGPQRHAPSDFLYFLPWGGGSTLGAQRDLFEGVGGFDERLLYAEDIDFCWRAQLYGERSWCSCPTRCCTCATARACARSSPRPGSGASPSGACTWPTGRWAPGSRRSGTARCGGGS